MQQQALIILDAMIYLCCHFLLRHFVYMTVVSFCCSFSLRILSLLFGPAPLSC